jgi:uncharacterized tellurite resistance protein B-like protein
MTASRDFYAGLGALVYALAKSDDSITPDEIERTGKSLLNSFGDWVMNTTGLRAVAMLESLAREQATSEQAYAKAMQFFTLDTTETRKLVGKVVSVLREVAGADNSVSSSELALIERFEREIAA